MSREISTIRHGTPHQKQVFTRLTLEEEILSLNEMAPEALAQLPELFAEAVVDSATKVLGEATGEAFIRHIGDRRLKDPNEVYSRLDSFLKEGSDAMKEAIKAAFRHRVHQIYKLTVEVAESNLQR